MNVKKTAKFAAGVCAALGFVAFGAIAASGAAVDIAPAAQETSLTGEADVEITPADFAEVPAKVSEN